MNRGLMKTTSLYALTLASGLALSASANAADLGGNCCADLEERVAELEATTARKGNRKVSLTISGQVNRAIMYWDDGRYSNTYFGLDNTNSSTRFGFSGSAKINAEWSAGFSILIDVADKARTYTVSNNGGAEDATSATPTCTGDPILCSNTPGANGDHFLRLRDANWWLQNTRLGRVTVGRLTTSGAVAGIDLGNVQVVASSSPGLVGGGLFFRDSVTGNTVVTLNQITDAGAYPTTRGEGVKWTSPTLHGFVVSASIAEAASVEAYQAATSATNPTGYTTTGRNLGVDLKYAGEFNGVRVAFGIGYEKFEGNGDGVQNTPTFNPAGDLTNLRTEQWGGSLALMHVPTGLFVQGDYLSGEHTSGAFAGSRDSERWIIQAGLVRNFFGIGNTTLYGEFGSAEGWLHSKGLNAVAGDSVDWWGVGMVQQIDAAAMDLYIGYRSFDADVNRTGVSTNDISVLTAGARIKF